MRCKLVALLCLVGLPIAAAQGAAERYNVEVVIVAHRGTGALAHERWQAMIAAPNRSGRGDLSSATDVPSQSLPSQFQRLDPHQGPLQAAARKLDSAKAYRVLRHLRWQQPALDKAKALPVRVYNGDPIEIDAPGREIERWPKADEESKDSASEPDDRDTGSTDSTRTNQVIVEHSENAVPADNGNEPANTTAREHVSVRPLDGTIKLVVSRYLHIHADLYNTRAVDPDHVQFKRTPKTDTTKARANHQTGDHGDSADQQAADASTDGDQDSSAMNADTGRLALPRDGGGQAFVSVPFHQSRRMRSDKLHYLDNPAIGLLVEVTPVGDGD